MAESTTKPVQGEVIHANDVLTYVASEIDARIGDINVVLDTINREVV